MSGKFLSPLYSVELENGHNRLTRALVFESEVAKLRISVPRDFVSDYASVPRVPFAYLLFGGLANRAAVTHDWLYSKGSLPRAKCDAVFREAVEACGVPEWKAALMYAAVRLFGGSHYTAQG